MNYKRILTIQDISCVGQCSLTVALPILSACGIETSVLPTAVLSTHTAGFTGYTFRDLTEDIPAIRRHWQQQNIEFSAIYSGYMASPKQVKYASNIFLSCCTYDCIKVADPAMGDNGKLYPNFNDEYVDEIKELCGVIDYVIPNITEACFMTNTEYKTEYDREYIEEMLKKVTLLGCPNVILTGVSYREGKTGVVVYLDGDYSYYEHELLPNSCHGTGDIYASAFVGALVRGKKPFEAAKIAADYTVECIKLTSQLDNHWYGAAFEPLLGKLIDVLG